MAELFQSVRLERQNLTARFLSLPKFILNDSIKRRSNPRMAERSDSPSECAKCGRASGFVASRGGDHCVGAHLASGGRDDRQWEWWRGRLLGRE
ncbi:hypothetical protein TorRG33x02_047660 [Trema orientale]|uniref:Uncharacterized protein n=1 Tax=Trema orientale TaxID=63057 RepID=A0A2P5FP83_TREOI|nr:hypothetical protein TorRG33x02_047660 [Trema orientale]